MCCKIRFYLKLSFINRPTSQTRLQVLQPDWVQAVRPLGHGKRPSALENESVSADFSLRTNIFKALTPQTMGEETGKGAPGPTPALLGWKIMCSSIKQQSVTKGWVLMETPYLYLFTVTYDLNSFQFTQLPREPVSVSLSSGCFHTCMQLYFTKRKPGGNSSAIREIYILRQASFGLTYSMNSFFFFSFTKTFNPQIAHLWIFLVISPLGTLMNCSRLRA